MFSLSVIVALMLDCCLSLPTLHTCYLKVVSAWTKNIYRLQMLCFYHNWSNAKCSQSLGSDLWYLFVVCSDSVDKPLLYHHSVQTVEHWEVHTWVHSFSIGALSTYVAQLWCHCQQSQLIWIKHELRSTSVLSVTACTKDNRFK